MSEEESKAFKEGREAYRRRHLSQHQTNPYDYGTRGYYEWKAGRKAEMTNFYEAPKEPSPRADAGEEQGT